MFKISSVGKKLYFSVLAVFLVFAVSFIVFQQSREKQFKINTLTLKLANYNELLMEDLLLSTSQGILLSDSVDMVDSVRVLRPNCRNSCVSMRARTFVLPWSSPMVRWCSTI